VEAEGWVAGGCGGDSERRRPSITGGDAGRGGEKAREEVEKAHEPARECEQRRHVEVA
jgi:hypothetical protein